MENIQCKQSECERTAYAKGFCNLHYRRMRKGQPLDAPHRFKKPPTECKAEGCRTQARGKGLCPYHYQRQRFGLPLEGEKGKHFNKREYSNKYAVCSVDGCENKTHARNFCEFHYRRHMSGVPLDLPKRAEPNQICKVDHCDKKAFAHGYCPRHHTRWKNGQDIEYEGRLPSTREYLPVGSRSQDKAGYWSVKTEAGWMRENRHVMEQHLGRKLLETETVHHLNGQRDDNRIENLELWTKAQPAGQRVSDKVAWAEDFLRQYAPEKLKP